MHYIFSLLFTLSLLLCYGQDEVVTTQPTIMVIPFTKEHEDIRTLLEDDVEKRICITKVKEGFDNRGFTTVDFRAKLKAALSEQAFSMENQTSLKQQIIENSGADIYVEVEIDQQESSSGNYVNLIITGYDSYTGQSLSNKIGESGKYYIDDVGKLAMKAVENCIEEFLDTMNEKFGIMLREGRSVKVKVGFEESSELSMDDEFGPDELPLTDALELWFEENAYKNNYHIGGTTSTQMYLDDVRIPVKDSNGRNYRPTKFALEIYKYIKNDLGIPCKKDVNGMTIFIRIL